MNLANESEVWAVVGGGNGGIATAGFLALQGRRVRLYTKSERKAKDINAKGGVELEGVINGLGRLEFATTDPHEAIAYAKNIIIVLPSNYHRDTAKRIIPHLEDGQFVLIMPEASCGAIEFRYLIEKSGKKVDVVVGATCNLPYVARSNGSCKCTIMGVKNEVNVAALPASCNDIFINQFKSAFPMFKVCENIIKTSLDNLNAMVHPGPILLNLARVENGGGTKYEHYNDGFTPSVVSLLDKMDAERISIAKAFSLTQRTIKRTVIDMYGCGDESMSLIEVLHNNSSYKGVMLAQSIRERFVLEDVPYSLVAMSSLGKIAGVPTPCIDAVILIYKAILGDELDEGRTLKNLGLEGISKEDFLMYVNGK